MTIFSGSLVVLAQLAAAVGGIHGTVRAAESDRPVAGVVVDIDGAWQVTTDSLGRYVVRGLQVGSRAVEFNAAGYDARRVTVLLDNAADVELDVELTARPVVLPSLKVAVRDRDRLAIRGPLESGLGSELAHYGFDAGWQDVQGPVRMEVPEALLAVPGVAGRGEAGGALSVRGAAGSDNLVLLDGIPIFGATSVAGVAGAFTPEALARLDLHTGVSSARFGGRLSAVEELETAEADGGAVQLAGALGPTELRSVARGSLPHVPDAAFLVGGRFNFRGLINDASYPHDRSGYADWLGVLRFPAAGGTVRLLTFHSGNHLVLGPSNASYAEPWSYGSDGLTLGNTLEWRSYAVGATWTRSTAGGWRIDGATWWSGERTDIDWASITWQRLHSRLDDIGVSASAARAGARGATTFGLTLSRPKSRYAAWPTGADVWDGLTLAAAPLQGAGFAEWAWQPLARVDVRAGVRGLTDFARWAALEPRISASVRPWDGTRIGIGAGRTHQAIQSLFNEENVLGNVVQLELPVAASGAVPVARADQLEIGVEQRTDDHVAFTAGVYVRRWTGAILPAASTTGAFATDSIVTGRGAAAGVVVGAVGDRGPIAGRVSGAIGRSVRRVGESSYHSAFERTWSIASDVAYRPWTHTAFQLSMNAGAGQPTSAVVHGFEWQPFQPFGSGGELAGAPESVPGPINTLRLPTYLRLDLGASRRWPLRGAGGSALTASVRLENLLDYRNTLGIVAPGGDWRSAHSLFGIGRNLTFELGWKL